MEQNKNDIQTGSGSLKVDHFRQVQRSHGDPAGYQWTVFDVATPDLQVKGLKTTFYWPSRPQCCAIEAPPGSLFVIDIGMVKGSE